VPERKVHISLSQRGRVRVGVIDISELSFPPPALPAGRGVFVQAPSKNGFPKRGKFMLSALPETRFRSANQKAQS